MKSFRDGFMPFVGAEVKDVFEELKMSVSPDVIFTHNRKDAHQDHRLIAELTWNTFRNHLILEYEIPKYDGDMGQPNVFRASPSRRYSKKSALHHGSISSRNIRSSGLAKKLFSRSCACEEWNVMLPAVTPRRFTAKNW